MENSLHINLEYSNIQEIAFLGIRRGLYFSTFAQTSQPQLDEFNKSLNPQMDNGIKLQMLVPLEKDNFSKHFENYLSYSINCGLREILESFNIFVEETIWFMSLIEGGFTGKVIKGSELNQQREKHCKLMRDKKYSEKLNLLKSKFKLNLSKDFARSLISLNNIRNCLAHNRGIISLHYFPNQPSKKKDFARIEWLTFDIAIENCKTGKKSKLKFGESIKEESNLLLKVKMHSKEQKYNEYLSFNVQELWNISSTISNAITGIGGEVKRITESNV